MRKQLTGTVQNDKQTITMPKPIKKLNQKIIQTIAAGEVIQSPHNAIKELLDNSIDAESTQITISLTNAGLDQIQIIDNGHGISKKYLPLSVQPHTTSKLQKLSDFKTLTTQGFRGEALFSISQTGHLTIASKPKSQQAGYQIKLSPKHPPHLQPIGIRPGTQITVDKLFHHHPVRKKYLSNSQSQLKKITDTITQIALANPHIAITLTHNQRQLLNLPSQTHIQRTQSILGHQTFSQMIPLSYQDNHLTITGFVSQPSLWNKRPKNQFLFINNRPIKHKYLQQLIQQTTNSPQSNTLYPLYTLHLNIDPKHIDPNIHPQKQTIDLYTQDQIAVSIKKALTPILSQRPLTYSSTSQINFQTQDKTGQPKALKFRQGLSHLHHQASNQTPTLTGSIQQLANLYLLAPTTQGLLLIDQHALHERLLYDQLKHTYRSQKSKLTNQKLKISLAFDLDFSQTTLLQQNLSTFHQLGFDIQLFGENSFKINSIPKLFADHDIIQLITDILDQIQTGTKKDLDTQTDSIIASMACRLAVKAGDYLKPSTRKELVTQLLETNHAGTCPHGRPVSLFITTHELNHLFRRT